ncbi:ATP synthase F0 subunit B [Desulfogranum marinum]|jgi:F-type H+-transporting ATPase subunit b|uniref:ATP synthase F0 subunit B n=1 Tax=Desulfogranum marinum TaxID=453220 RepID=UPI001962B0B5|nr:ATP synthase F0 subunit B [Desulfogranum marinum]MBM9511439.1 ATP synthase F0 subunit B [Desulfogranum marinum]
MISIDITMVIHIINMIVLMLVLNAILYKPVLGILEKRKQKVDSMHDQVAQLEQRARNRQLDLDRKMREGSGKAKKALDAARASAQAAGAEKLAAIRQESDGEKEKQMAEIRTQVEAARKDLQAKTEGFARDMAGKILGRSLEA